MNDHEKKIELMRKYASEIKTEFSFHIKGNIPSKKVDMALKKFANGMDRTTVIGFYDTTVGGSGKNGYIFTDTKIYYLESFSKPKKIWYDEIKSVEVAKRHKSKDCDKELVFHMYDGTTITWSSIFLNKTPLCLFLREMFRMINETEPAKQTAE